MHVRSRTKLFQIAQIRFVEPLDLIKTVPFPFGIAVGTDLKEFKHSRRPKAVYLYRSLREEVRPMVIVPGLKLNNVAVRLKGGNIPGAMEHLAKVWREFVPEHPFEYRFASDLVAARYQSEVHMRTIAQYASLLAASSSLLRFLPRSMRRRAFHCSIRTKHAAIPRLGFDNCIAPLTLVKILTSVGWHEFVLFVVTYRTRNGRMKNYFHSHLSPP